MNKIKKSKIGKVLLTLVMLVSVFTIYHVVSADTYLLTQTQKTVYVNDYINLSEYLADQDVSNISYSVSDKSINPSCVLMGADGKIKAKSQGSAIIAIKYTLKDQQVEKEEEFTVTVVAPEQLTAAYGSKVNLKAFDMYSLKDYTYSFSNDSLAFNSTNSEIIVQGFADATVSVKHGDTSVTVATIKVTAPAFTAGSKIARAVGTGVYTPAISNYTPIDSEKSVTWSLANTKIATVTEQGITPVAVGTTSITAKIKAKNGDVIFLIMNLTVTNPVLSKQTIVLAKGNTASVAATGTCDYSTFESGQNTSTIAMIKGNVINAKSTGIVDLKIVIDGKTFTVKVVVTNPRFTQKALPLYKGLKKTLPIAGLNKTYSKISYSTGNKKVATITKAGKITAKKVGVTKITVKADGKTFKVWLEISTKKAYKAAKKEIAISKTKTKYSQARRMSKGYYDCSSIVSRVYRKYGSYFGNKSGWSPTAAGIGSWCTSHKKVIAKKGISYTKLVPGDLIFYSYTKNGRYRNISHIEMYVGNGMSVSASSSRNKVVHYNYSKSSVVLIARPQK